MLTIDTLTHVYPNGTRALDAVTLDVPRGMVHYQKGLVVMCLLKDMIGADAVNRALQGCCGSMRSRPRPIRRRAI